MKLTDLRPCDGCHGPLLKPPFATFNVVRVSQAMLSPDAARGVIGLTTMLGSLRLAEVMAGDSDAVKVLGEQEPALWTELFICQECLMASTPLAMVIEARSETLEKEATNADQ